MPPRSRDRFEPFRRAALRACLAAAAAASCASFENRSEPVASVRAAVSASWADHVAAAQRKDLAGVMAIYAEDAIYSVDGAPEVRGADALRRLESGALAGADVLFARHETHEIRVFGDTAFEIGTVEGPVRVRGEDARNVVFRFMALWRRNAAGEWRLAHLVGRSSGE